MTDGAIDIRYRPTGGPPRKVSFRPRSDGGWFRVTLEWTGCTWRETGCEPVDDVALECADGIVIGE